MRLKFIAFGMLLVLLLSACRGGRATPGPTPASTDLLTPANLAWLKAHAIPFDAADPTAPLQDLISLKSIVGDARIVALGDASFGTHEFLQMKHRLLEYLVETMRFNTFAIDVDFLEAERVDAYIHNGEGDPATLMKGLTVWNTQEVLDMIEWMRTYNADPARPRKISFHGFGLQSDQLAREKVSQFIQKVDPQETSQIKDDYACFPQLSDACMKKLQDVIDLMNVHRTEYTAKSSPGEFEKALHGARIVIQYVTVSSNSNNNDLFGQYMVQYMTENVEWIVDQAGPEGKVVVWAHNGVVGMFSEGSNRSMGDYLHQQYGDQMVVFGFLFYHGSFHALGVGSQNVIKTFHAAEPPGDSYPFFFQATGLPRFFLDMRSARADSPDQEWLFTPHASYQVGAMYNPNNPPFFTVPLAKMFDVVIYFKDTTPSVLLNQ